MGETTAREKVAWAATVKIDAGRYGLIMQQRGLSVGALRDVITEWCVENLHGRHSKGGLLRWFFESEDDAVLFCLKWEV